MRAVTGWAEAAMMTAVMRALSWRSRRFVCCFQLAGWLSGVGVLPRLWIGTGGRIDMIRLGTSSAPAVRPRPW
ncbi:hypothetical protein BIV25_45820 [Streptomyces sp. MUSC 14]|nr:hypothetical protein BIV25_45820 [Streptomyces sp. MUSC 14]